MGHHVSSINGLTGNLGAVDLTPDGEPIEVTGARDDGTALASLLSALEDIGFITDSTTAT